MNGFVDILLKSIVFALIVYGVNLLVALFSSTIFNSFFIAKKKFLKEVNDPRFMVYEVVENKENEDD